MLTNQKNSVRKLCNNMKIRNTQYQRAGIFLASALMTIAFSMESNAVNITSSAFAPGDTVVTFETGTTALPGISGVSFGGGDATFSFSGNCFGSQYFGNLSTAGGYTYLDVYFTQAQQAVGAYLVKLNSSVTGVTEVLYDSSGDILDSASENYPASGQPLAFLGLGEYTSDISEVEWRYNGNGFFGVDNLTYGVAAVPEPASYALLGVGILVLGAARVRRARSL